MIQPPIPTLPARAALISEEAAYEKVKRNRPLPNEEPDDPRRTDACANPRGDSQDTMPAESACTARRQDRMGALSYDTSTSRPLYLQATIGTQTDETNQTQIETLLKNETPAIPKETIMPGLTQPKCIRIILMSHFHHESCVLRDVANSLTVDRATTGSVD